MRSEMPWKQRLLCLAIGLVLGGLLILVLRNYKP